MKQKYRAKKTNNKQENATPTPMLNNAWAYSHEVIFSMQPSMHWMAHVGEGMVHEKHSQVNHKT